MKNRRAVRIVLFPVCVLVFVALSLSGCGEPGDVAQTKQGSAAAFAQESFESWTQAQGIPYQNVRYDTLTDDGAFATVRITAEFRPTADSSWREQEALVDCRKVGNTWQCDQDMRFAVTTAQVTAEAASLTTMPPIAFASDRDGNFEIYVMDADGSSPVNLTNDPAYDDYPAWSPDGKHIAFVSDRNAPSDIYVMNADGSNAINITNDPAEEAFPAWSPDGNRIAFISNREGDYAIYVMNADGSNPARLVSLGASKPIFNSLTWSPDGHRIAFVSDREGDYGIRVMNVDGSNPVRLTNDESADPAWSPDGHRIAFVLFNRDGGAEIYVMNADGSKPVNLTPNLGVAGAVHPAWSPDGSRIAFFTLSGRSGGPDAEIFVMNADGSNRINLTNNPAYDWNPAWAPRRP